MIKKSTLLVLLCAAILGGVVYYLNVRSAKTKLSDDAEKPAFSIDSSTITSITLSHPARPDQPAVQLVKTNGDWQITQPMETGADSTAMQGILDALATSRVSQTESGAPDRLKAYGLAPPQVLLEFQLQNGAKHSVSLGKADFTGDSAYGIVDGSTSVSLLPKALYTSVDKSFDDLRDRSVLPIDPAQVASFELKNSSGDLAASKGGKDNDSWIFTKPVGAMADDNAVSTLLGAIENGKATVIASEKPDDLGKYGLANPAITFTATDDKGRKSTVLIGKKDANDFFARDIARPQIFGIDANLYKTFGETYADLRDKKVAHFDQDQMVRAELHDADGAFVITRKPDGSNDWTMDSPADMKGKPAMASAILGAVDALRADEMLDHPPANISAGLAKPAVEVMLTDKAGKVLDVRVSKESGDFVYARTSESAAVYKLKKQALQDLDLKAADLAPSP